MIHLEKLTRETSQLIRKWRNHDRNFFKDKNLITHKQQDEWFSKNLIDLSYWYFIVYKNSIPIGCIGFSIVNKDEAHIESVILGDKLYSGMGCMSDALQKTISCFPFKKYSLSVIKTNASAIKFYEKNGFTVASEDSECYIMNRLD